MSNYLFYLFLERSNFDIERPIFFFLIKFMGKNKQTQKKRKTEELVLACKQQIINTSTAVVLNPFVSENTQKGES